MNRKKFLKVLGIGAVGAVVAPKAIAKSLVKPSAISTTSIRTVGDFTPREVEYMVCCDPISPEETMEIFNRTGNIVYSDAHRAAGKRMWEEMEYEMLFGKKP